MTDRQGGVAMRPGSLTVERAHTGDIATCTRLLRQFTCAAVSHDQAQCLQELLQDPRCSVYLGRLSGEAVALLVVNRRLSLSFEGIVYAVEILVVDENYRRIGCASAMLEHLMDEASKGVCRAILLDVTPDNLPGRAMLRSLGFTHAGRLSHWRRVS
jgi:ribosomal protein S18 acetylase RimI-like enzyme